MTRQTALPAALPPRLISRDAAAAYICVSPTIFDEMVADGRMPAARKLTVRRIAWDVRELDSAVDRLPRWSNGAPAVEDSSWGDIDAA
ncbi:MAG: hypothetical protein JSS22_04695 [Proteobacteria bacterium]|nr:hypothetical protein [Pseudomonadota bacterium]